MSRAYGTASYLAPPEGKKRGMWFITAEPQVIMRLRRVFARVDARQHGTISIVDGPEVCRDLQWFMQRYRLTLDDASRKHLQGAADQHRRSVDAVESILNGTYRPRSFALALPARDYQLVAADLTIRFNGLLLADDVGLGKSASAICVLAARGQLPAVVVTMTHLPTQWAAEIKKFAPDLTVGIAKATEPHAFKGIDGVPDVTLLNYAKLPGWADELAPVVRTIVFDEVQELRHCGTRKYSAAQHVAVHATTRIGLSATPIYNYGNEIYNVLEVLRPGELGSGQEFHHEWCGAVDDRGRALISNPKAFGMHMRETGMMLRRTRKEVGRELPVLQRIPFMVDVEHKYLREAEDRAAELAELILKAGGGGFEKMRAAEEFDLQLRQATGLAKAPGVAAFVEMLVDAGEPVLLYGWHHAVYDVWYDHLSKLGVRFYTGRQSDVQKRQAFADFVARRAPILIMSLRAGAGLDGLQAMCRTVVNGELDWSPQVHVQGIGRVHRDGQTEPVTAYDALCDHGSDPTMAEVLGIKSAQSLGLLDPNADLVELKQADPERIKKMAADLLARRKR